MKTLYWLYLVVMLGVVVIGYKFYVAQQKKGVDCLNLQGAEQDKCFKGLAQQAVQANKIVNGLNGNP